MPNNAFCLQFHPEVAHTDRRRHDAENFVYDICGCRPTWTMRSYVDTAVEQIKQQVGTERDLCIERRGGFFGRGRALDASCVGDQLTCIFVDNGCCEPASEIR